MAQFYKYPAYPIGQRTAALSMPVVLASDQSSIPVTVSGSSTGRSYVTSARNDYTGTPVTTGAWVQVIASTPSVINGFFLFHSGENPAELGAGGLGSEARILLIPQGGISGFIPLTIASGTRLSLRGVSGSSTAGELDFTGLS